MLILMRLITWSLEIALEVLLLMALLFALSGTSRNTFSRDLALAFFGVAFVFMVGSGYVLTTAICRIVVPITRLWIYSVIAATLFVVHEQSLFRGRIMPDASDLRIILPGAGIVFACTLIGSWVLRKWIRAYSTP